MKQRLFACILCFAMVLSMCTVFSFTVSASEEPSGDVWDGTSDISWYNDTDTEFVLQSAAALAGFADLVNEGNTFEGKTVTLDCDVILNKGKVTVTHPTSSTSPSFTWETIEGERHAWKIIGKSTSDADAPFKGTFDGANHTVWGCYFSGGTPNAGFFGYVVGGTVKNLTATGYIRSSGGTSLRSHCGAGGIVGAASGAVISNCHNEIVTHADIYKDKYITAGGVVGYAYSGTQILDCSNNATIYAYNSRSAGQGGANAGGICGIVTGPADNYAKVTGCENYGSVYARATNGNPSANVGGIAGSVTNTYVSKCTNYANLQKSQSGGGVPIGGIASSLAQGSNIYECINYGNIVGGASSGGIVANISITNTKTPPINVYNCVNHGDVTTKSKGAYVGGICGSVYTNSSGNLLISIYSNVNTGNIIGYSRVAGITSASTINGTAYVYNNVNTGDITGIFENTREVIVSGGVTHHNKMQGKNNLSVGNVILLDQRADTEAEFAYTAKIAPFSATSMSGNYYSSDAKVVIPETLAGITTKNTESKNKAATTAQMAGAELYNETQTLLEVLNAVSDTYDPWYQGVDAPLTYEAYATEKTVKGATLILADAFSIDILVAKNVGKDNLTVTYKGATGEGSMEYVEELLVGGIRYYRYTLQNIAAFEMSAKYDFTVAATIPTKDGEGTTQSVYTISYSILDYAANQYNKTSDAELKALLESIVYYGAAAEGSTAILDAFAEATGYAVDASYVANKYAALDLHKIVNEGADTTLVAHSPIVSLYLDNTIRPCFQMEGAAYIMVEFNGKNDYRYDSEDSYFIIDCLYATALEDGFRVKAYDENDECIGQMKYSVATYVLDLLGDESGATDAQKTLAMATAVYMNQAKAYKISH